MAPVDDDEIDALVAAFGLKDETRTGWQLRGIVDPESVAAHTWGVAFLCLVFGDRMAAEFDVRGDRLDVDRALRLAIVHDLAEAETGDFPTRADPNAESIAPAEKARRERRAIDDLTGPIDADGIDADWAAYEARETPAAVFVKEMDCIDMCLQALVYERERRYDPADHPADDVFEAYDDLDEFFATAGPRLRTDLGRSLFEAIYERYRRAIDAR
ncbi:MAG: HD domain-containing protein [Halobacteriota archaeon]